jgi:putative cofactor-binding repeat protein
MLSIGSRAASDSLLAPKTPMFESGQLSKARHWVDSIFYRLENPTVFDYLSHYGTNAYVNSVAGNFIAQLNYTDSAIALVSAYLPNQVLSAELANLLINRGDAYFNLKNYAASFEAYFQATKAVKEYPDNCSIMRVEYNIGMILYKQQQFEQSAQYFKEALAYTDRCQEPKVYRNNRQQEILDNIGLCYTKLKQYDSASTYYRKALAIVLEHPYALAVDSVNSIGRYHAAAGVITGNMAKVYAGTGQADSAIAVYKRAIDINGGADLHDMQLCMIQLSDLYLRENKLGPMEKTLQDLRASLDKWASRDLEADYQRLMYSFYQKKHEDAKALTHLGNYMQLKDSAMAQQSRLQQTDIGRELRDKEQQFEIRLLQKNNELGKTYTWLFGAIAVMAIIILALIYNSNRSSKKNIRRLTEMNAAITDANREKDRILRVVAHDLRNPIGAISTLSQLMTVTDFDREKSQDLLRSIESLSVSAITLINDLLVVQQSNNAGNETLKTTDLKHLLQQAVMIMQFKANEKGQQIKLELPSEAVFIPLLPVKTQRLIDNLLANAIKFSPVNGTIRVALTVQEKTILLSFANDGTPIPAESLPKIFDHFTTAKTHGTAGEKGFGLGLSICKQIAEEMHGRIWAVSEEGRGSVFFVELWR